MTEKVRDPAPAVAPSDAPRLLPSSGWSVWLITLVAGAMCFLAVLALAASMAAERLAAEWRSDLAGVATVRVSASPDEMEAKLADVLEVLRTTPGIASYRVLDAAEQEALLEPWLGAGVNLADWPAPRLIDIRLDGSGPDAAALQKRLELTVSGVTYDDHAAWRAPLASAARALERLALGATILVLLTAGGMVAFAARSTLAAHRDVIATVRLMGADDPFIAGAFVQGLARRAAIGGFGGAALASGALLALPTIEADRALGAVVDPGPEGWAILALGLPAASALVAWLAARGAVRLALRHPR